MNTIENKNYCTGCDKHCPANALQCGKGRRIFGLEGSEEEHSRRQHGEGRDPEKRGEHRCHGKEHGHDAHCCHEKGHGHCEHHGHGKEHGEHHCHGRGHDYGKPWWEGRDELSALLGRCGHHLFKRPGKGRGQGQILRILAEKKRISQRQLQEILDIKPGSLSESLSKLEGKGLILREKSEEDKRAAIVSITEAGEAVLAEKAGKEENADLFACLTQEEKASLESILNKLLTNWENGGSEAAK